MMKITFNTLLHFDSTDLGTDYKLKVVQDFPINIFHIAV